MQGIYFRVLDLVFDWKDQTHYSLSGHAESSGTSD